MLEKELKILEVDIPSIKETLRQFGAEQTYQGPIFDIKFHKPQEKHLLKIRLRKKHNQSLLTFKSRPKAYKDAAIKIRNEYEYEVDRQETFDVLTATGLVPKRTKFKQRISFQHDTVSFDIDHYPSLPPIMEIEGPTQQSIFDRVKKLELQEHQQLTCGTKWLFKHYGFKNLSAYA